jgi:hypothetical protein
MGALYQVSILQYQSVVVNTELERTCNEAVVAEFEVLSQHLPAGTEEDHKTL